VVAALMIDACILNLSQSDFAAMSDLCENVHMALVTRRTLTASDDRA
jgi:hypothetical protein